MSGCAGCVLRPALEYGVACEGHVQEWSSFGLADFDLSKADGRRDHMSKAPFKKKETTSDLVTGSCLEQ